MMNMASIAQKLTAILKELEANSDIGGCAVVSNRGQIMASALHQDIDEKSVAAMAAALTSVAGRVGKTLGSGDTESISITGTDKIILTNPLKNSVLIAIAPANAKLGLLDYELEKSRSEITKVLG